jgi:hypothetical protein
MVRRKAMNKEKEAPAKFNKAWIEMETWDDLDEETQYTLSNPNGYSKELVEKVGMRAMMGGFSNVIAIEIVDMVVKAYKEEALYEKNES